MTGPRDGIFNIDKAAGITSMDVVRQVKRLTSHRHIGHAGTLDPEATGVLPVCLGQATRLMQFVVDGDKEYLTTTRLGVTTDTYDSTGQVVDEKDPSGVTQDMVEAALIPLRGTIQQMPPVFSALKRQGRRLHELARAGVQVEMEPRTVEVIKLDLIRWHPPLVTLYVNCSRGLYIRSLAHDLGQLLGCGAHVAALRRIRTGPFHMDQAVPLEKVQDVLENNSWASLLLPPDYIVLRLNAVGVSTREERQIHNGQAVPLSPTTHYAPHLQQCRAYSSDGRFVALVRFNRMLKLWQPFKVFHLETSSPYKDVNPLV